jgi:HAD superfamily hydrolase (TIGR01484 family)
VQPLALWPAPDRADLRGVFTDIDDTLTTDGHITPDALAALARLKAAGLSVIAITGRPVGWSKPFASSWPVDAIVAENGAVALVAQGLLEEKGNYRKPVLLKQLSKLYQQSDQERLHNYARLQAAAQQVLQEMPGVHLAQDSAGRETDIAFDHSEFVHMPPHVVAQVVALLQAQGLQATVSSIHINAWLGDHNKLQGAHWITQTLLGRDLALELNHWAYVGDSTNDALMFEAFSHSVGVANVRRFEAQLSHLPRYITPAERGAGFAQVVQAILAAKP